MADTTTTGLKDSRPVFFIDGAEKPQLAAGLVAMTVVENTTGLYRCEARFGNWGTVNNTTGFLYFDRRTLEFGKGFKVQLGREVLFDGKIMGLEAVFPEGQPPEITVLAEDRFQDLRMTRRTRTFADVSDAAVFTQIANEHGLTPGVSVGGPTHKVLAQVNQSDLAFMRERARAIDAELWMEDKTLHVKTRAGRAGTAVLIRQGNELREFAVLADLAMQRTSVTVSGWDVSSKSELRHEATESVISSELNGDASGASILASAFGRRAEALAHTVPLDSREAQAEAESFFKYSARRFLVGGGVADANAGLRVGGQVELQNLGPLFGGKYYLTEVRHLFDSSKGIRTEFRAERPGIGRAQ